MLFRFTLNNTIEGSQVISNPDGWKEIKLKLERDKEYHSLVEMIEVPLIFCGSDGSYDGGYNYIRNIEDTQGIDAQIEILIEVSEDQGTTYETFFEGLLELETIKEISDAEPYKLECNIVRNDFWSKFFNRKSQQVDLGASVSLDGEVVDPIDNIEIQLPSQRLRLIFKEESLYPTGYNAVSVGSTAVDTYYAIPNFNNSLINEIKERFTYPDQIFRSTVGTPESLLRHHWKVNTNGIMTFDNCQIAFAFTQAGVHNIDINWHLVYGTAESTYTDFVFETQTGLTGSLMNGIAVLDTSITLNKFDEVYIYAEVIENSTSTDALVYFPYEYTGGAAPNGTRTTLDVTFDSDYENTSCEGFLLRDAAESILSKIISRDNVIFSNYLGDETPTACAANFAIMKGLHVRGYTMFDKPMFMSFDEWWDGANPIFNLGLGYEVINGTEYIRIEDKGYFYGDDYSLTFSNVDKITRVYDKDKIFKSIEIGYQKWSAESASGVDDPQTKHTYNTRFKVIGKDEKILSKFFAASLGIEQTRRNRIEFGKDWRLDEDTIIIALRNDATPFQPETDESFSSITDLLNSETRYNIRLTPARNFERWKPFFNGCLQLYIPETYNFASGEGNYNMASTGDESCDSGTLAENQDISVTTDFYHGPGAYEFEFPMNWEDYKTVRDNRNKAIRVSNTTSNYKLCKIDVMEYDHFNSMAEFTVWIKE